MLDEVSLRRVQSFKSGAVINTIAGFDVGTNVLCLVCRDHLQTASLCLLFLAVVLRVVALRASGVRLLQPSPLCVCSGACEPRVEACYQCRPALDNCPQFEPSHVVPSLIRARRWVHLIFHQTVLPVRFKRLRYESRVCDELSLSPASPPIARRRRASRASLSPSAAAASANTLADSTRAPP